MHISMPIITWLDSNSNNKSSSLFRKLGDSEYVETFIKVDPCIDYIKSHDEQPIFLITSDAFALQTIPPIYESSNVLMIFIFCTSMKTRTNFAMDCSDKLLMFDDEDDLVYRVWCQFEEYSREQAKKYNKQADECKECAKRLKQPCG